MNIPAVSADETVTVTVLTPTEAAGGGRSPGTYNVGTGTARTRTVTIYDTPTVSISDTGFPDSIIQGGSGTITLERSGATSLRPVLQAYVRVTSTSFTNNNIFLARFARYSATATVTVNIPANTVRADETATVTVLAPNEVSSGGRAPVPTRLAAARRWRAPSTLPTLQLRR